ncbi:hypothetical protein [Nonomuraea sp. SBT364]|nr:hypothetical protein [Nonomuraea sp. SBT364]
MLKVGPIVMEETTSLHLNDIETIDCRMLPEWRPERHLLGDWCGEWCG